MRFYSTDLQDSDAYLYDLTLTAADGTTLVTLPSSITSYDVGLVAKGQTVTFLPQQSAYGAPAALSYTWNGSAPRSLANTNSEGTYFFDTSPPLPLKAGMNTLVATVTSPSGKVTKTYTLTMQWAPGYSGQSGIEMVNVNGGSFQRDADPANISTVSSFMMGKFEVTQRQWRLVASTTYPAGTSDCDLPIADITWNDMAGFCNRLSELDGLDPVYTLPYWDGVSFPANPDGPATADWTKNGYRLPTEMEWMWAAMGGTKASGYTGGTGGVNTTGYLKAFAGDSGWAVGSDPVQNMLDSYVWSIDNSGGAAHPVGQKLPNELGFYDMSGNAEESCWDLYQAWPSGSVSDYHSDSGTSRVNSGGTFSGYYSSFMLSNRNFFDEMLGDPSLGFRVARGLAAGTTLVVQPVSSFVISGPGWINSAYPNPVTYAVPGQTFDEYSWYINGVLMSGETASSISFNVMDQPDLLLGANRIMVIVRRGATWYSEELNITMADMQT
jgi:formylglycine-generating enzyme required for sulfatase activity